MCILWSSSDAAVCPMEQEVAEDHTWMWHRCSLSSQSFPQQHHHTLGVTRNERWEKPSSAHCSERDRDLRMSNNYIKQLKKNQTNNNLKNEMQESQQLLHCVHVALAPGGRRSLCTPSTWGSGHGHCSGGSRGHWGSARPGFHWLPPGRSPLPD